MNGQRLEFEYICFSILKYQLKLREQVERF